MKKFLAILVCKLGRFVGKLVGRGSSLPGQYALKICPDILRQITLPRYIIAVTGSNGKTSTVEMIAAILRAEGKNVVYNEEGSNQIEGVTTTVLTHSTFGGVMSFLGLCGQPPDASLGALLSEAQGMMASAPWYALCAGGVIVGLIFGVGLIGEGLQGGKGERNA